jgi:hypothetical protein
VLQPIDDGRLRRDEPRQREPVERARDDAKSGTATYDPCGPPLGGMS